MVATDNLKGGELAAQRLIQVMGGKGKALMVRYQVGSASTEQREAGFLDGLKKAPGITLVSSDQYAGPTVDTAFATSQNVLSRFGSQVDGIYTPNESSTVGMLRALDGIGKTGKVKFVGFDANPVLVQALQAKQIDGLVVQNPFKMGDLGVTTLVQAIQKQKVDPNIDTGVTMVTLDNIKQPDVDALLHPPLAQYLK
jgi:ribose transport system substrate-binding protein